MSDPDYACNTLAIVFAPMLYAGHGGLLASLLWAWRAVAQSSPSVSTVYGACFTSRPPLVWVKWA